MPCIADPTFPLHQWDKLLSQAELTLNLLCKSRLHPKMSAWTHLEGNFDFNHTPMAPAGTKVLIFKTTKDRASWETHGDDGWCVGPAMEHCRCYQTVAKNTLRECITNAVTFYPEYTKMPTLSSPEVAVATAKELAEAIRNPQPAGPYQVGDKTMQELQQLSNIFSTTLDQHLDTATPRPRVDIPRNCDPLPRVEIATNKHASLPRVPNAGNQR